MKDIRFIAQGGLFQEEILGLICLNFLYVATFATGEKKLYAGQSNAS
jgi:hypothetical protein